MTTTCFEYYKICYFETVILLPVHGFDDKQCSIQINYLVLLLHQVWRSQNQCLEIGYCYYIGLVESYVVLLLHLALEITKSVPRNRVLLLHGFGAEQHIIVTTSGFEDNKISAWK
jgi:hypothetical protein